MKPQVFVASSTGARRYAEAIQVNLEDDADVVIWTQDFELSRTVLDELLAATYDFGIFIFLPEDETVIKGERLLAVRDNVVFELGLFIGKLGKDRNFLVVPKDQPNVRIPSDLSGLVVAYFDPRREKEFAALGPACTKIRNKIRSLWPPNLQYQIANKRTGQSLDVAEWGTQDGIPIVQWPYHGGDNQRWVLKRVDRNYFSIFSKYSEKCVQVAEREGDQRGTRGMRVNQYVYTGGDHQQWEITRLPEGSYKITAKDSRLCLTVENDAKGAFVVQDVWNDSDDRLRWWLVRLEFGASGSVQLDTTP